MFIGSDNQGHGTFLDRFDVALATILKKIFHDASKGIDADSSLIIDFNERLIIVNEFFLKCIPLKLIFIETSMKISDSACWGGDALK